MLIFKLQDLSYEYKLATKPVKVLDNINLNIVKGELITITGPSGSGKSTLLHLLGCILRCQVGKLYVGHQDVSCMSDLQLACTRNQHIGFVFQQFFLLPKVNILDNILLPIYYPIEKKLSPQEKEKYISKAIDIANKLGLGEKLYHLPKELSGGEQQRVAIARSLIKSNNIIIADEPTGNLDSKNTELIIDVFKKLNKEGYTVIIVTHDPNIAQIGHRSIHLKDGKIEKIIINKEYISYLPEYEKNNINVSVNHKSSIFKLITRLAPIATKNLLQDKIKYFSNMIGIIIGVANIMAMIALGQFLKEKVLTSYSELGTNVLTIHGYQNWNRRAEDKSKIIFESFSIGKDIVSLQRIFPQISSISPLIKDFNMLPVAYGSKTLKQGDAEVIGVSKDFFNITNKNFLKGGPFYTLENKLNSYCVIGYQIFNELFLNIINPIGKVISVGRDKDIFTCKVIGVLDKQANDTNNRNLQIYLPYDYFISVHSMPQLKEIHSFVIKAHTNEILALGHAIEKYLKFKYSDTGVFAVDSNTMMVRHMDKFINLSTIVLIAIAILSLLIGGVGIINMMLVSVQQRIKEIGIRKAIGATNQSIRIQLLLETFYICFIGGTLGIILGVFFYEFIIFSASKFFHTIQFEIFISIPAILFSFLSLVLTGLICGIIPALKAETLDIIFALKEE